MEPNARTAVDRRFHDELEAEEAKASVWSVLVMKERKTAASVLTKPVSRKSEAAAKSASSSKATDPEAAEIAVSRSAG